MHTPREIEDFHVYEAIRTILVSEMAVLWLLLDAEQKEFQAWIPKSVCVLSESDPEKLELWIDRWWIEKEGFGD